MTSKLDFFRTTDFVNLSLRYNPIYRSRVRKLTERYTLAGNEERSRIIDTLQKKVLHWASGTSYGGTHSSKGFREWPVLAKAGVRECPEDFVTRTFPKLPGSTGGTTGQPLKLYRSLENIAVERYFIERLLLEYKLDMKESKVAVLRADEIKDPSDGDPPYGIRTNRGRTLVLSNSHLSRATIDWFVDELRCFAPSVLYVYPTMLENLLLLMTERSVTLSIPVVLSSSEMVNPDLFDHVETMLGGQLIDFYGQGERVAFAHATSAGQYRFNPLYGTVELSPLEENTLDSEYSSYAIIATGHWNSAMPLVRYETGDIALVSKADLPRLGDIERGDRTFAGLLGRQSEFILGPDGEVVSGLNHVPRGVSGLIRAQIVQTSPTQIEIRAQASPAFDDDSVATLLQNAHRMIPASVEIRVEVCDQLERASSNKIPFVIRRP